MTLHVFLLLLVFVLMFSLTRLCSLCWPHHALSLTLFRSVKRSAIRWGLSETVNSE